ncbi:Elongation of very long chain fatty acids protein 7 [Sparganum proliferum]
MVTWFFWFARAVRFGVLPIMDLNGDSGDAPILQHASSAYARFLSSGDPRVSDWAMMSSPMPTFVLVALYLFAVWWGQKAMAQRPSGFELRHVMVVYNSCMVALSAWLCHEFCASGWFFGSYTFGCQPVDASTRPQALRMARACWWFYISKLIELADTIFFVLRRKFQLITFLHVFHHAVMAASWWFGVKFVPGGFSTFHALINSFIHTLMYTYYALAAAGPQFHPYLWWKRYLTTAQILQFIIVIAHTMQLFFFEDCDYPIVFGWWILSYAFIFLGLFGNFYYGAYVKPKRAKAAAIKSS